MMCCCLYDMQLAGDLCGKQSRGVHVVQKHCGSCVLGDANTSFRFCPECLISSLSTSNAFILYWVSPQYCGIQCYHIYWTKAWKQVLGNLQPTDYQISSTIHINLFLFFCLPNHSINVYTETSLKLFFGFMFEVLLSSQLIPLFLFSILTGTFVHKCKFRYYIKVCLDIFYMVAYCTAPAQQV